jgi:hypothetical protein
MDAGRFVDAVRSGHDHPVVAASAKLTIVSASVAMTHDPEPKKDPKPKAKRGRK